MTTDDPDIDVGGPDPNGCAEQTGYVEFRLPGDLLRCIVLTVQTKGIAFTDKEDSDQTAHRRSLNTVFHGLNCIMRHILANTESLI